MSDAPVEIRSQERGTWPFMVLLGGLFGGVGLFILYQKIFGSGFFEDAEMPFALIPWFIGVMFSGLGGFALYTGLVALQQSLRWGASPLLPDPHPGSIGGDVGGRVQFRGNEVPTGTMHLRLECEETRITRTRSGGKTETRYRRTIVFARDGRGTMSGNELQFRFSVPAGQPATLPVGDLRYAWKVIAETPEGDLRRTWVLPVIEGDARSTVQVDSEATVNAEMSSAADEFMSRASLDWIPVPKAPGWKMRKEAGELRFHARMGRNIALFLFLPVFASILGGIMLGFTGMWDSGADREMTLGRWIMLGVLPIPIALFGIVQPFMSLHNRISSQGGELVRRLLGIPIITHRFEALEFSGLVVDQKGQKNANNEPPYAVFVRFTDGKRRMLVANIDGQQRAEALKDAIAAQVGAGV